MLAELRAKGKGSLETVAMGNPYVVGIPEPGLPSAKGSRKKKRKMTASTTSSPHRTLIHPPPASPIRLGSLSL